MHNRLTEPLHWERIDDLVDHLTQLELSVLRELNFLRHMEALTERITDTADPLKSVCLTRQPSKDMRRRRAASLGCEDWFRRGNGRLAGQLLLQLD